MKLSQDWREMSLVVCGTLSKTGEKENRISFYREFPSYRPPEEYAWHIEALNKQYPYAKLMMFNEKDAILASEGSVRLFVHAFEGLDGELETDVTLCWSDDDVEDCLRDVETIGGYYKILTLNDMQSI